MSDVELWAPLPERGYARMGVLYPHRKGRTESVTLQYDPEWVAAPAAFDLDPSAPRGTGTVQTPMGTTMFGALQDCSPDRWGRALIRQAEQKAARDEGRELQSLSDFDHLMGVRDDLRQGDLRLRFDGAWIAPDDAGVPELAQLPELLSLADRAMDDDLAREELARLVRQGSSLGGARPKAHVADADGRIAIAKFPSAHHDTWDVMAWERVALELAERAGIWVPSSQLIRIAGRSVLIVARFDRAPVDGGEQQRVGFRSSMTMCERTDGDDANYVDIAEVIEEYSPQTTTDLRQLWRRMAFNTLISNTDDHLRNHAFLHAGGDAWQLSPAYDLNPNPEPAVAATALSPDSDERSVDVLLGVSDWFRLDRDEAIGVLAEVVDAVGPWRSVAACHGLGSQAVQRMEPAFVHQRAEAAASVVA